MTKKSWLAISFGIVFICVLMLNFGGQVGTYSSFGDVEKGEWTTIIGDSTWAEKYNRNTNTFSFKMKDKNGIVARVKYFGPKPANFGRAEKVILEGEMQGNTFHAQDILIKCPSKYNNA